MLYENLFTDTEGNAHLSTMPTASSELVGKIVQYTGDTNSNFTKGYSYECTQTLTNTPSTEHLEITQTAGLDMGDFTYDIDVFKSQLNPTSEHTYQFSCVGYPNQIQVSRFVNSFEFATLSRDTVFDNSRAGVYSWVDDANNYYFTNTEVPNSDTVFYETDSNQIGEPSDVNSGWEYITTSTRLTTGNGMWVVGLSEEPTSPDVYGLYNSSRGFIGTVLSVKYVPTVLANYSYQWTQKDTQPRFKLTEITGYDATKTQTLKNNAGNFIWEDVS